jgi:hypothetical protein
MLAYWLRYRAQYRDFFPTVPPILQGLRLSKLAKVSRREFLDAFLEARQMSK